MGALPELAPIGENHILRSSSVIQKVSYSPRRISDKTFDPTGIQLLRLNFKPVRVTAGGTLLTERKDLKETGYTVEPAAQGDYIVQVRYQGSPEVVVEGK
jgi:hypothetical protein